MDRRKVLEICQRALNTQDGKILLKELQAQLSPLTLGHDNPTTLAYMAGQRDAFEHIRALSTGELNREREPRLDIE